MRAHSFPRLTSTQGKPDGGADQSPYQSAEPQANSNVSTSGDRERKPQLGHRGRCDLHSGDGGEFHGLTSSDYHRDSTW